MYPADAPFPKALKPDEGAFGNEGHRPEQRRNDCHAVRRIGARVCWMNRTYRRASTATKCNSVQTKICIHSSLPQCCLSRRRRWRGYRLRESSSRQSTYADIKSDAEAYCGHVPVPFQKTSDTTLNLVEAAHRPVRSTSHEFAVPHALHSLQSQGARASRRG